MKFFIQRNRSADARPTLKPANNTARQRFLAQAELLSAKDIERAAAGASASSVTIFKAALDLGLLDETTLRDTARKDVRLPSF